jgi:hypothetical protein
LRRSRRKPRQRGTVSSRGWGTGLGARRRSCSRPM